MGCRPKELERDKEDVVSQPVPRAESCLFGTSDRMRVPATSGANSWIEFPAADALLKRLGDVLGLGEEERLDLLQARVRRALLLQREVHAPRRVRLQLLHLAIG